MKKNLGRLFNSISTKVILIMLVMVLPLNFIAIIANKKAIDTMVNQNKMSAQTLADTFTSDIESRMANTHTLLYYFLNKNPDCIQMKLQEEDNYTYQSSKQKLYYSLRSMGGMTDGGDGYFYYMKKMKDVVVYDENTKDSKELYRSIDEFIENQLGEGITGGWHIYEFNTCKYLFLIVEKKNMVYGGWFNLDALQKEMENSLTYTDYSIEFTEDIKTEDTSDRIFVSANFKNLNLIISVKKNEIVGGVSKYVTVLQTSAFLYLALIPLLFIFLKILLIKPLNKVNYAHRQIKKGNQDYRITQKANSVEYMEAYQSFNQMADNIKTLRIEGYERELARQKIVLRNLQLQIRPHFLLNTFNLIYTLAQRKEMAAVQQIILYLSEYFRYIFRSDKELELFPKELKLIQGYVKMVSINYSGNVEANFDIESEVNYVRVPPLLIHNFIENSVKHGVKQGTILHITITGRYADKKVIFQITDDGKGMDEETLDKCKKLLQGDTEPENSNSGIGLSNSIQRLKHFYGQEATIDMMSVQGQKTSVIIQFPYNLEVEDEVIID